MVFTRALPKGLSPLPTQDTKMIKFVLTQCERKHYYLFQAGSSNRINSSQMTGCLVSRTLTRRHKEPMVFLPQ